jgi:hypothetical protein
MKQPFRRYDSRKHLLIQYASSNKERRAATQGKCSFSQTANVTIRSKADQGHCPAGSGWYGYSEYCPVGAVANPRKIATARTVAARPFGKEHCRL